MMRKFLLSAALALLAAVGVSAQSNVSYVVGEREAQQFAYGWGATPGAHLVIGNSATGAQTVMALKIVIPVPFIDERTQAARAS